MFAEEAETSDRRLLKQM